MTDIDPIYMNNFGIAFQWPTKNTNGNKKIQMVFRDTGLLLCEEKLIPI